MSDSNEEIINDLEILLKEYSNFKKEKGLNPGISFDAIQYLEDELIWSERKSLVLEEASLRKYMDRDFTDSECFTKCLQVEMEEEGEFVNSKAEENYTPLTDQDFDRIYDEAEDTTDLINRLDPYAKKGDLEAQLYLGQIYEEQEAAYQQKEFEKVKAEADKGDADALYELADRYAQGVGVEKNEEERMRLWKEAAEKGSAEAQFDYSWHCKNEGRLEEAFGWMKKAAENGLNEAQFALAEMYENGEGTEKNPSEASHWNEIAEENEESWSEQEDWSDEE